MEKIRILLIEDNPDHAFFARQALNKTGVYEVTLAESGEKALEILEKETFSLIFADYDLPKMNGLEVLREIKNRKDVIPLVLVTGHGDERLAVAALREGAYNYIIKSSDYFKELPYIAQTVIEKFRFECEKESLYRKMSQDAIRDDLTQIYNHRYFQERLIEEFSRANRYQYPLSCIMMDLDFFKSVNERYGHQCGDRVLMEVAQLLKSTLRASDILARYGGEEFVFLLPETSSAGAREVGDRLRKLVAEHPFQTDDGSVLKLTVSGGIACYPEDHINKKDQLIELADRALFKAKTSGRDKICLYGQTVQDFEKDMPRLEIREEKLNEIQTRIYELTERVKRAYIEATKALIYALEAKDPDTKDHSQQVGKYSYLVAKHLGISKDDLTVIEHAGLLHDIGKVCISDDILLKPGTLTHEEFEQMKEHPVLGYKILQPIKYLHDELPCILYHHEWYNGQGYPHGLKGREIPLGARIVSVCDAYVTMLDTSRVYRKLKTKDEAINEMIRSCGTQFDPKVVNALIEVLVEYKELNPDCYNREVLEEMLKKDPYK